MRKASTLALIIGALILVSPLALRADMTPSQSFTIITGSNGVGDGLVNRFDPTLGTLTGFSVTLTGSITWDVAAVPDSVFFSLSGTNAGQTFTASVTGNQTLNIDLTGIDSSSTVLPYFTGTGANSFILNNNDVGGADTFSPATLNGTIVYDYTPTPVPEPSSVLLLGVGLLGLAVLCGYKKRRAHSARH